MRLTTTIVVVLSAGVLLASLVACGGSESQGVREDTYVPDLADDVAAVDAPVDQAGDTADVFEPTCLNECSDQGATDCDANSVVTCGNYDDDPCLEWGLSTP